jgi:FKBP12-rapamycin complex-associated protein
MYNASLHDRLEPVAQPVQLVVNQQHLRASWDTSQISSSEDWREWIRRFAIECLKESPSHALRSCRTLADSVRELSYLLMATLLISVFSIHRC